MKNKTTFADFKKMLNSAIVHKMKMKTTVVNKNGEIVRENDFAPVHRTQSNAFTLLRNEKESWIEYGKASEWDFTNSTGIIKSMGDGGKMILNFEDNTFFGL